MTGESNNNKALAVAGGLAVAAAGGALCAWLGTPLPWMIGPMVALAIAQFSGTRLQAPRFGRELGQLVVGVSLGLYFTPPVVRQVGAFGWHFVALGVAAIAAGGLSAWILARYSGVDRSTAWFASMPGGAAEMANLGDRYQALPDRVALAHSLRLLVVVIAVPVGVTLMGFSGSDIYIAAPGEFDAAGFAALLAIAGLAALAAQKAGIPNAYMLGPLMAGIALTVGEMPLSSVPAPVVNGAQLLLACSLGVQFQRSFLREAPRFVAAQLLAVAAILVVSALVGLLLAWASGAYLGTALLSAAPGGIAEMAITAKVLKIGVPFVTAAHVVRYVIVVTGSGPVFVRFIRPTH